MIEVILKDGMMLEVNLKELEALVKAEAARKRRIPGSIKAEAKGKNFYRQKNDGERRGQGPIQKMKPISSMFELVDYEKNLDK